MAGAPEVVPCGAIPAIFFNPAQMILPGAHKLTNPCSCIFELDWITPESSVKIIRHFGRAWAVIADQFLLSVTLALHAGQIICEVPAGFAGW